MEDIGSFTLACFDGLNSGEASAEGTLSDAERCALCSTFKLETAACEGAVSQTKTAKQGK